MAIRKQPAGTIPPSPTSHQQSSVVAVRFITVEEFATPPIHDALVLGKQSPIGCMPLCKGLAFLQTAPFTHIEFEDDVISDIIARESILRINGRENLIKLILERIKPLMTDLDILHMDFEAGLRTLAWQRAKPNPEPLHMLGHQRLAEEISLTELAVHRLEYQDLVLGLDAFGNHADPQV